MLLYANNSRRRQGFKMRLGEASSESTGRYCTTSWLFGSFTLLVLLTGLSHSAARADAREQAVLSGRTIVQPGPLTQGPGSTEYRHKGWRVSEGGEGYNGWYAFEPVRPKPATAPVAIVSHGYGEFTGYDRLYELIRHTVLKGTVVVFPRWQTSDYVPCPGPFHIESCMDAAVRGIHGGLDYLRADPDRVQPDINRTSYYGYSFGGIITANIANQYLRYGLPRPRAIFLDDPHDGEVAGLGEPALDDSLAGIPRDVKLECHSGADGVLGVPRLIDGSCNALFAKLSHIPKVNKSLTMTRTDSWGVPTLSSAHGVCASNPGTQNAYDWRFCWRDWDAIRACALRGKFCYLSVGAGPRHRWLGRWSDGTPMTSLVVQKSGPLTP